MPDSLLQILKVVLLVVLGLFFLRVLRAVWAELRPPAAAAAPDPPAAAAARAASSRQTSQNGLRLRVVDPPETKGRSFELADELTVGRAPGCGVSLPDTTVSQLHARIFRSPDGRLWVEDLGSTNGTFVNRKKVSAPAPLRRGDRLQVGQTVLEVAK
jgi:pSer/pThr/pTyr-binding forkhead associated (FHA) protein